MSSLQQWKQLELYPGFSGTSVRRNQGSEEFIASHLSESPTGQVRLMESILERSNMKRAVKHVIKNKGAPGVDGMTVRQIKKVPQSSLGKDPTGIAGWGLYTHAGTAERDS